MKRTMDATSNYLSLFAKDYGFSCIVVMHSNRDINDIERIKHLKENLFIMRKAIDDYYADQGDYPGSLQQLVEKRYIRKLPVDPLTDRGDTWVEVRAEEDGKQGGIIDVRSGSEEKSGDGAAYQDW